MAVITPALVLEVLSAGWKGSVPMFHPTAVRG
jgi:hypothetical protein